MTQSDDLKIGKNQYFPFKIESLIDNTEAHFDAYTQLGTNLLLYAKAPYRWTSREITDLLRMGVYSLYVLTEQKSHFDRYISMSRAGPKVDLNLAPKFRIQQLQDVGAHLMEMAFMSELTPDILGRMELTSRQVVDCLLEEPGAVKYLKTLVDHDQYTYIHSVGVGCLAAAMAIQMGENSKQQLLKYALGGLLHDVGKKHVPLSVLNKSGPLNPQEWEQMKTHPEKGIQVLENVPHKQDFYVDILKMVFMHHEKLDGSGYPHNLSQNEIPLDVQLVTVADIYNALTTSRCYHSKRTRFEALMFMKHNLTGKVSSEALRSLVKALADDGQNTQTKKQSIDKDSGQKRFDSAGGSSDNTKAS